MLKLTSYYSCSIFRWLRCRVPAVVLGIVTLTILTLFALAQSPGSVIAAPQSFSIPVNFTMVPLLTTTPTSTPTMVCGSAWHLVASDDPGISSDDMRGIAVIAPDDVWAVGNYNNGNGNLTLTEHWDGSIWSTVLSPNSGSGNNKLFSVSAVSSDDVWAAGSYLDQQGAARTLIEHWDGSAWNIVGSPNIGSGYNYLNGVTAISASDIWAAGYACTSNCLPSADAQNLILHWDGSVWAVSSVPNLPSQNNYLWAVASSGTDDVWAVGEHNDCYGCTSQTLTLHWDGTQWAIVASPNIGSSTNPLRGVTVLSSTDAWAVGDYYTGSSWRTLIIHWDGTSWSLSPSPNPGQSINFLEAVSAVSPNDIWAVGSWETSSGLTLHWDGASWSIVTSASSTGTKYLNGVSAQATDYVWAVGNNTNGTQQTLTQLYNDPCATPTPTSTPTDTPTSVPTHCAITFSDVLEGSTFYPYVRCLACLGIINGYADGTFKPNNDVTRGQLSKIVANSAGFSDPQPDQMFDDVPVGSTFQVYIGRLASRGFISGYPCGGSGEPCGPNNLPYFRPNNNATRGQISKIVSNAAGFNDDPLGQQFEDVLIGSTYYTHTYRLVIRNIMSGYLCGGIGEPCGPDNRPYFRPNSDATRGQTSKIDSGAFFPGCNIPEDRKR